MWGFKWRNANGCDKNDIGGEACATFEALTLEDCLHYAPPFHLSLILCPNPTSRTLIGDEFFFGEMAHLCSALCATRLG